MRSVKNADEKHYNIFYNIYIHDVLIAALIVLLIFRGFIDNFLGYGTLYVDICFIFLLAWIIFAILSDKVTKNSHKNILYLYIVWCALCLIVGIIQVFSGKTSLYDAVLGYRNNNVYTGLFLIAALKLNENGISRYYKLFVNLGVFVCVFAICQFIFRDWLPESLLILKDEDVFSFYGRDEIRVTGLIGNTIIFGGFTIILFSLVWGEIIVNKYKSLGLWLKLIIIAVANYFTFSRASVIGMVGVFFLEFIIYGCTHGKSARYLSITFGIVVILLLLALTVFRDTIIVQRVFGFSDVWTEGSDEGHFSMIADALSLLKQNWLFGTLLGQSSDVITDGAIWAYMLEMGLPVFVLYIILIIVLVRKALINCRSESKTTCFIGLGFIAMIAYFMIFSFINSAYMARSVLPFVWFTAGIMLASDKKQKQTAMTYVNPVLISAAPAVSRKKKEIIVDGLFLTEKMTGVQRFACEVLERLSQSGNISLYIALPKKAQIINKVPRGATVIRCGKLNGRLWEQICLPLFCKKKGMPLLCTGNIAPVRYKNKIVILHDVVFCEDSACSNKSWAFKIRTLVRAAIYRARAIYTVSQFSSGRIMHFYKGLKSSPRVLGAGWEHILDFKEEEVEGVPKDFYLTVGSNNPNKNFDYIKKLAADNPDKNFVVTGLGTQLQQGGATPPPANCRFAGYVSDGQLKWLYSHCKGYIFPSLYEGFGVPPLEAVACGCRNLFLSDIPPHREIYGGFAAFFDPSDYEHTVDLSRSFNLTDEMAGELLNAYSWDTVAAKLENYLISDLSE